GLAAAVLPADVDMGFAGVPAAIEHLVAVSGGQRFGHEKPNGGSDGRLNVDAAAHRWRSDHHTVIANLRVGMAEEGAPLPVARTFLIHRQDMLCTIAFAG